MKTKFEREFTYSIDDVITVRHNPDALFVDLTKELAKRFGNKAKLIYAYLIKDPDSFNQFLMIFKQIKKTKSGKEVTLYAAITAIRYSDLSLNMYALCKRDDKLDLYFKNFFSEPVVLEKSKFELFITAECGLSLSKTSDKFWKNPDNNTIILDHLQNVSKINYSMMKNK